MRRTCLKNLNSVLTSPFSWTKTSQRLSSSSTSASWQSSSHSVGGLEVEIGRLNPATHEDAQATKGTPGIKSVLAVHASGCSYKQWGKLGPLLSCPLVAPNLYGYGRSQPWPSDRSPDMADFMALLTSANAPPPVHLIGHSMGGGIGLAAAATSKNLKLASITGLRLSFSKERLLVNHLWKHHYHCRYPSVEFLSQICSAFSQQEAVMIVRCGG